MGRDYIVALISVRRMVTPHSSETCLFSSTEIGDKNLNEWEVIIGI